MRMVRALDKAANLWGPVGPDIRVRVKRFLEDPTPDNWSDICGVVVEPRHMTTIWQVLCQIDPTFPRVGRTYDEDARPTEEWVRVPTPLEVLRAVRHATAGLLPGPPLTHT